MSTHRTEVRHDCLPSEVTGLFKLPFNVLLFRAHQVYRLYFNPGKLQISTLLSIKTGACPEDCKYYPQSVRYDTGLEPVSSSSLIRGAGHAPFISHKEKFLNIIDGFLEVEQMA